MNEKQIAQETLYREVKDSLASLSATLYQLDMVIENDVLTSFQRKQMLAELTKIHKNYTLRLKGLLDVELDRMAPLNHVTYIHFRAQAERMRVLIKKLKGKG